MKSRPTHRFSGQAGFTLVELVVVIAILGVLSAVAVPFIVRHLSESKDRAYNVDQERFQQAVDSYYSSPGNVHFLGQPQYPIMGMAKVNGSFIREDHDHIGQQYSASHDPHDENHSLVDAGSQSHDHTRLSEDSTALGNPLGGTQGGSPIWIDNDDGIRGPDDEELLDNDAVSLSKPGWHVVPVTRKGTRYIVDSRDYFIDFDKLVARGLLDQVPLSASPDNRPDDPPNSFDLFVTSGGQNAEDNHTPAGLTLTPSTTNVALWTVDQDSHRVFQYSLEGAVLGSFDLNGVNQKPVGITTDGNSFWVLDRDDKKVYRYDLNGTFRDSSSFNLGSPQGASFGQLEGITTDGTSVWVLDRNDGVFRYSAAGIYQGSFFELAGDNARAKGIATDGASHWILDQDDGVYLYPLIGGIPTSFSIAPVTEPEGIATDGSNIWVVDKGTGKIYPFGLDGGPAGPSSTGLYKGSYSWYVDPEGKVKSLSFYFPESNRTGFQTAYP